MRTCTGVFMRHGRPASAEGGNRRSNHRSALTCRQGETYPAPTGYSPLRHTGPTLHGGAIREFDLPFDFAGRITYPEGIGGVLPSVPITFPLEDLRKRSKSRQAPGGQRWFGPSLDGRGTRPDSSSAQCHPLGLSLASLRLLGEAGFHPARLLRREKEFTACPHG